MSRFGSYSAKMSEFRIIDVLRQISDNYPFRIEEEVTEYCPFSKKYITYRSLVNAHGIIFTNTYYIHNLSKTCCEFIKIMGLYWPSTPEFISLMLDQIDSTIHPTCIFIRRLITIADCDKNKQLKWLLTSFRRRCGMLHGEFVTELMPHINSQVEVSKAKLTAVTEACDRAELVCRTTIYATVMEGLRDSTRNTPMFPALNIVAEQANSEKIKLINKVHKEVLILSSLKDAAKARYNKSYGILKCCSIDDINKYNKLVSNFSETCDALVAVKKLYNFANLLSTYPKALYIKKKSRIKYYTKYLEILTTIESICDSYETS